jgi:hypothetical protein
MQVGDVGVLQNLKARPEYNGAVSEIMGDLEFRTYIDPDGYFEGLAYLIDIPIYRNVLRDDGLWVCPKNNIRPLSDPDKEQDTEQRKEVVS